VPPVAARRPRYDHHPASEVPRGDDPRLAIVPAIIDPVEGGAAKHLGCIGEVEAALF
jgi:hypothetical protein